MLDIFIAHLNSFGDVALALLEKVQPEDNPQRAIEQLQITHSKEM